MNILFLHHSTGQRIWDGGVASWFDTYNRDHSTDYRIVERVFPKSFPYGWRNYPFDYWNIWINHAGPEPYVHPGQGLSGTAKLTAKQLLGHDVGEPTLEVLTADYEVIVFKHCFPVGMIEPDTGDGSVDAEVKRLENYKLQYAALKEKLHSFADTKFILWTGAVLTEAMTTPEQAARHREFVTWVREDWDEYGDNIFLFDFYELETEGGLYLKPEYADAPDDSHPTEAFAKTVAPLFGSRVVSVIEGTGDETPLTGRPAAP